MDNNEIKNLADKIRNAVSTNWTSEQEKDLCNGCKYFESSWHLLIETLYFLEKLDHERCNECKYYDGVHGVQGHAPCKFWGLGAVLWDDSCRRFKQYEKEPESAFGFISRFEWAKREAEESMKRERIRFEGEDKE